MLCRKIGLNLVSHRTVKFKGLIVVCSFSRYTELKMTIPEGGHVALHADNMTITNISVDGEPADFEYFPHYQVVEEARFCSVSCSSSAANVACSMYTSSLDKEMVPNLLIACNGSVKLDLPQEKENGGNSVQDSCSQQVANGCNGHPEDKVILFVLSYTFIFH